ncbi:hypothetical protein KUCAC02_021590 [Chaenocephalus aceratus]|uniref:Uncharacterized protein n=1 Tax=Chaenocephalus aceratus TaxID=36190 RepID=A0ACB9XG03_CHAAC|nr:hypothetical protein KUCAC02_021590 [Chaenocephalus aceratus]
MEECLRNVQPESSQCVTDDNTPAIQEKDGLDDNSSHHGVPVKCTFYENTTSKRVRFRRTSHHVTETR